MTHFRRQLQRRIAYNASSFNNRYINCININKNHIILKNILIKQNERHFITTTTTTATTNRTILNTDNVYYNYRYFFSKSNNDDQSSSSTTKKSWFSLNDDKNDIKTSNTSSTKESEKKNNNRLRSRSKPKDQENLNLFTKERNFQPNTKQLIIDLNEASKWQIDKYAVDYKFCRNVVSSYYKHLLLLENPFVENEELSILKNPQKIQMALSTLLKTKIHTTNLSNHLRTLETLLASISNNKSSEGDESNNNNNIIMTDELSFRLLEAHGKAGNIGRCLSLLQFRKKYDYKPRYKEFIYSIQSIISASLPLRTSYPRIATNNAHDHIDSIKAMLLQQKDNNNNNEQLHKSNKKYEQYLTQVENPTRWLDAILINMNERNFVLNDSIVTKMLSCFSSSGRSSRSLHWFYQTKSTSSSSSGSNSGNDDNDVQKKVHLKFNAPPSSSKLPSSVLLPTNEDNTIIPTHKLLKAELRIDKILEASILFTKSLLTGGVVSSNNDDNSTKTKTTPKLQLSTQSYNSLIKTYCHRGAFVHAFDILHKMKVSQQNNDNVNANALPPPKPNVITYNTILSSLARVGDITLMLYLLNEMISVTTTNTIRNTNATTTTKTVYPLLDKYTSQAICDGYLNTSDINGAITQIEQLYNNYNILPPYTTHYKVLEFSLGVGDIYEAKRYLWFLQNVWKDHEYVYKKIGKEELKHLFKYFGVALVDEDDFYVWNSYCENNHGI